MSKATVASGGVTKLFNAKELQNQAIENWGGLLYERTSAEFRAQCHTKGEI